ncbi:phenylalanine and histidine ammonia-lyase [Xylariaceae sp. FL1651]|nr:phenylalanine and histidine ammonia-lyase [Xylariaceae sp. FL1651]
MTITHTDLFLGVWQRVGTFIAGQASEPIVLTGRDLTIADVITVARYNARTEISAASLERMERSLFTLLHRLQDGDVIYGVNTNFGGSADLRTSNFAELQRALIRELHYGVLPPGERDHHVTSRQQSSHHYDSVADGSNDVSFMPWSWARAAIVIRINSLVSGCSAVRPVVVERMQDLLHHDIIPMIPLRGSISASGDLSPLSYICGAIQGKSTIRVLSKTSNVVYADTALAETGLEPVMIEAKEGLAMTNGTAVSAAAAVLGLHDTHSLAVLSQILTAMSVEALNGTTESFHEFFSQTRPHPGQTECARNILSFLAGSKLTRINDGANGILRQDRYSIRTVPQWIGPILEDLVLAHQQISIECNSVTDNPLASEGKFLHGGNFQAKSVTSAMEKARQATQGIGRMLFSQCTELINPATNRGLPPNLVADDPNVSLVFKGTDLYIAALASELGFLANPVNHVQTAEMGNQSLNSLALISARYTHTANDVLSQLVALHLIAVCQALDLRAMNIQFLELYKLQFTELVTEHYMTVEHLEPISSSLIVNGGPTVDEIEQSKYVASEHPLHISDSNGKNMSFSKFAESLWNELLLSLETTASIELSRRFDVVAKSLRPSILDNLNLSRDPELIGRLERFTQELSHSLHDTWCANRDAYLAHGDATNLLGSASKVLYRFVRHTLKVPILSSAELKTPTTKDMQSRQAPTIGSYTGAVYRALKDGTVIEAVIDLLEPSEQSS